MSVNAWFAVTALTAVFSAIVGTAISPWALLGVPVATLVFYWEIRDLRGDQR